MLSSKTSETDAASALKSGAPASTEEIQNAIQSLTAGELIKLERYAFYRIRSLGKQNLGREGGDLLREAMALCLSGERRWNRSKVGFFNFLVGIMRSVSSHWKEKESQLGIVSEKDVPLSFGLHSPLESTHSEAPSQERLLAAHQLVNQIRAAFAGDPEVLNVMKGFEEGLKGPEVQAEFGMTRLEFESAVRRLRRRFERDSEGEV